MFHRRHPHLAVLGPANLAAGGYWGLAAAADLIVGHLVDELTTQPPGDAFARSSKALSLISVGICFHQKEGHLSYVNAAALDEYSAQLAVDFGSEPLAMPADFQPPEVLDIDEWLATRAGLEAVRRVLSYGPIRARRDVR